MNSLPNRRPIKYAIRDPTKFPIEPAIITNIGLNLPIDARYPEKGMITSLGIGINALSATISKKIPKYPELEIMPMMKFVKLLIMSKATKCYQNPFLLYCWAKK